MEFRKIGMDDAEAAMRIIDDARLMMGRLGRNQWQDGYPARRDIENDIRLAQAWGLYEDGRLLAYGAVCTGGEPTYRVIEGRWISDVRYLVVHRLAVASDCLRRGVATVFMENVEKHVRDGQSGMLGDCEAQSNPFGSIRVDTNDDNEFMLGLLAKLGYTYCGIITLQSGSKRMAFEKLLSDSDKGSV
ncbi:MAG: GNAT family N-acetyltransferase [Candidatus Cryptobacteroides sp.]